MAPKKKEPLSVKVPEILTDKLEFPTELGKCIDLAYDLRAARLAFEKEVEEYVKQLNERFKTVEDHIINSFNKSDIEGAKGQKATAGISKTTVAQVENWDKLWAAISKNQWFDLVQRRVNDKAYRDRLESKIKVPGVVPYVVTKLSLTKR